MDTSTHPDDTVAVLLAAGGGSRFAGATHKLLAPLRGRTVSAWALDAVLAAGFRHVVVVAGATAPDLGDTDLVSATGSQVHVVHNDRWQLGQSTSVHAGLTTARALGATAVVIGLADQPFVRPDAWTAVAASSSPIAVATYSGRRGNPVRLAAEIWDLVPSDGDEGARSLMRLRPELVEEVPCQGSAADIDTLEDLDRWT
jgi:CTP:molybdopterin cytidylyltransferase MocA